MSEITRKTALLVGNGFSINFDSDYANIYDRLFDGHKEVLENVNIRYSSKAFEIWGNSSYSAILELVKNFTKDSFNDLFKGAIEFAEFIIINKHVKKKIINHKAFSELTFGHSLLTVIESIYNIGNKKSYKSVNIENWTALVTAHYILCDLKDKDYYNRMVLSGNLFIKLLMSSNIINIEATKNDPRGFVNLNVLFNGFSIYFKNLMAATIFNSGKSIELNKMNNLSALDLNKITEFTGNFEVLMTLNYDHILESVTKRSVTHLHGKFGVNEESYVYHQFQFMKFGNAVINISDLKIGDYIFVKGFAPTLFNLSVNGDNGNKKVVIPTTMIPDQIKENSLNHIFLFGMNVENDFHILRGIMLGFCENAVVNPKVTYCHFNEEEKKSFEDTWYNVITFGKEYSEYSRDIELEFLDSKQIINDHFLIKEKVEQ